MRLRDFINVYDPAQPFRDEIGAGCQSTVDSYLTRKDWSGAARFQREMIAELESLAPSGIGKDWRKALRNQAQNPRGATRWKAQALNLDATDPHMPIALACFAPAKIGDVWMLAVPLPLPRPLGPKFADPEEIVLIDPKTGGAILHGGDTALLLPSAAQDRFVVMADAKAWAREIATAVIEWLYRCDNARREANINPAWDGYPPSALAIGDTSKIIWPQAKSIVAGQGIDAADLKKVIFRQAAITRVESPMQIARAA